MIMLTACRPLISSGPYVSATGPPERIFNARTKYIIVDNAKIFSRPAWLLTGLEQNYQLETTINGMEIYRRIGS